MSHSIDWQLLSKYLAGECTSGEAQVVDTWVEADPSRRQLMSELENIWNASEDLSSFTDHAMDLDREWSQLSEAMTAVDARSAVHRQRRKSDRAPHRSRHHRRQTGTPSLQKAMHVLLAGLILIGGLWLGLELWGPDAHESAFREVIAERGERAAVQLVDGTNVTLNVDSRLRIPTAFGDAQRAVRLEGEAYFDVATDSTRPFLIYTQDAVIDVHGTAFNVNSYPEASRVEVAVVEGAVSLRAQQTTENRDVAHLKPGQIGRLAAHDTRVTTQTVDSVASLIGWMDGRLIFENETLPEVTARLERWYNFQFEIADPALDSLRLTASLKSRSIENVLDVITASLGVRYQIDQHTVVLSDDNAPPVSPPPLE